MDILLNIIFFAVAAAGVETPAMAAGLLALANWGLGAAGTFKDMYDAIKDECGLMILVQSIFLVTQAIIALLEFLILGQLFKAVAQGVLALAASQVGIGGISALVMFNIVDNATRAGILAGALTLFTIIEAGAANFVLVYLSDELSPRCECHHPLAIAGP
jgi:hypothetical protein